MNRDQDASPNHSNPRGHASPSPATYGHSPAGYSSWFPSPHPQQQQPAPNLLNPPTLGSRMPEPPHISQPGATASAAVNNGSNMSRFPAMPPQQFAGFPFVQRQFGHPQPPIYGPPGQQHVAGGFPQNGPVSVQHSAETGSKPVEIPVTPATSLYKQPQQSTTASGAGAGAGASPGTEPTSHSDKSRVRVNKACERCRNHKIKCSGKYPCSNCQKSGISCRYRPSASFEEPGPKAGYTDASAAVAETPNSHTDASPGKNVPDTESSRDQAHPAKRVKIEQGPGPAMEYTLKYEKKNVVDRDYVTYLENRVRYLESVVAKTSSSTEQASDSDSQPLEDVVDIQRPSSSRWRVCRRYQGALAIRLCTSLYEGLSPEAKAQVQIPRTNYYGFNMSGCHYLKPEDLPRLPDVSNFSPEEKDRILAFFFDEINPLYAIVHEKVFREQYQAFHESFDGNEPSTNMVLFTAMLSLVTALSVRFMEFMKPEGPSRKILLQEESLFRYAHKVIHIFSTEWESFELIQCWLLAALYFRIAHRQTSCFLALGRALSMCQSMGLGRYEKVNDKSSPYELKKAKRIFFTCYTFDRVIGLQGGRNKAMLDSEIHRPFPSLDYEKEYEDDGWMTLPGFAMLHIARIANYLDVKTSTNHDMATSNKMNHDFEELRVWLDKNGFNDNNDIFESDGHVPQISSMVKAQVKFHFYDLLQSIHGKMLFSFFGNRASIEVLKSSVILETNQHMMGLLQKVRASGNLYAPWYLTLQTILTIGVNSLVFINGGIHVAESRRLMKDTMTILQILRHSPVYDRKGKVIFKQRFKMADECNWLFKMISHIMALHCEESLKDLHDFGTDHGSSEVNKRFLEFEKPANPYSYEHKRAADNQLGGDSVRSNDWPLTDTIPTSVSDTSQQTPSDIPEYSVDAFLDNFAWFDKWLDFNHEV